MTEHPFVVIVQRQDGTTQTVFSHADLYRVASEAFQMADKLSVAADLSLPTQPRAVTIERNGHLELSIAITPGRPL